MEDKDYYYVDDIINRNGHRQPNLIFTDLFSFNHDI